MTEMRMETCHDYGVKLYDSIKQYMKTKIK